MENLKVSLSVVIPAHNEQDNIVFAVEKTISEFKNFKTAELIIVNDGSNDNTQKELVNLLKKHENLVVLEHNKNEGLAKSLKDGFSKASNDYILFNSADLPLEPANINEILEQKFSFDLLVIERKIYTGASLWRKFVSVCNRIILHICFPLALIDIADCNFTFIIKKEVLKEIFPKSISPGFIETEIILRAKYLNFNVQTIECDYDKRKAGKAHFGKIKDILLTIFDMFKFRIYSFFIMFRGKNENNIRN